MGQSVRGLRVRNKRPTHINCDDLEDKEINKNPRRQKEVAEWILRDLIPTMDGPTRRFTYSNNRFAQVMIQTLLQEMRPKWFIHEVNAYNPVTYRPAWKEKYAPDYFKIIEEDLGPLPANAEYNNSPHVEGSIFKDEQFQWCDLPRLDHLEIIVGHWDIAYAGTATSDFNAVAVSGLKDRDFFLVDGYCKQSKMKEVVEWMCDFQKGLPASVRVHWQYESQFWNDEVQRVLEEVQNEKGINLYIIKKDLSKGKKYDRILKLHPYFQNSRIYFSKKLKAKKDIQVGLAQLKGIEPSYKVHDDFPDAFQYSIAELELYVGAKGKIFSYRAGKMKGVHRW